MASSDIIRNNSFEMKEGRFRVNARKKLFMSVGRPWNRFPRDDVDSTFLEVIKVQDQVWWGFEEPNIVNDGNVKGRGFGLDGL